MLTVLLVCWFACLLVCYLCWFAGVASYILWSTSRPLFLPIVAFRICLPSVSSELVFQAFSFEFIFTTIYPEFLFITIVPEYMFRISLPNFHTLMYTYMYVLGFVFQGMRQGCNNEKKSHRHCLSSMRERLGL